MWLSVEGCRRLVEVLGCTGDCPSWVLCIVDTVKQKAEGFVAGELLGLRVVVALGLVGWVFRRQIHFRLAWWLNSTQMGVGIGRSVGIY